jgi:HAD superfamily hydrolase (TIGR01549 family)
VVRAVLFDLDDTLFDHRETSRRALAALRAEAPAFQIWSLDEFERRHVAVLEALHRSGVMQGAVSVDAAREERFRRLWRQIDGEPTADQVREAARVYRRTYVEERRLVPGARALLRALRPKVRIGIVTNNILSEQEDKLARFDLRPLVDVLVVSAEEGVSKPEPDIFHAALARLGCDVSEAVMVGDSWEADVVGATRAGVRAVWFNRRGDPNPDASLATEIRSLEPTDDVVRLILDGPAQPAPVAV